MTWPAGRTLACPDCGDKVTGNAQLASHRAGRPCTQRRMDRDEARQDHCASLDPLLEPYAARRIYQPSTTVYFVPEALAQLNRDLIRKGVSLEERAATLRLAAGAA